MGYGDAILGDGGAVASSFAGPGVVRAIYGGGLGVGGGVGEGVVYREFAVEHGRGGGAVVGVHSGTASSLDTGDGDQSSPVCNTKREQ